MDERIFERVILTNEKLDGILARIEFLIGELEDEKSSLFFATHAQDPQHNIMSSEKKFNEFFTHDTREVRKAAIKPQLETLQEVVLIKSTVVEVLRIMKENGVHLDLNINPSIAMPTLTMVANLTNLLMLVFSSLMAPARIFHEIYQRLTQTNDDVIKELKEFMGKYAPYPVDVLQEELRDYEDLISKGVFSAQKVLQRTNGQVESQMGNLLASQAGMTTPDQNQATVVALGHRDVLQPIQVARVSFLCFLAVGTPWDARGKTGAGFEVIKAILTSGWVLQLHRHIITGLHSTIRNILDRSKDRRKGEKKRLINEWEKEMLQKVPFERRDQRRKLADILEKYCWLMEDQVCLVGPRIFLLLTLLNHAAHEVNWLVLHQNLAPKKQFEKEEMEAMATDQETIRLLFYIVKMRDVLKATEDLTRAYTVDSVKLQMRNLQEQEGVKLNELDHGGGWREMLEKVQNGVESITRDGGGLHRYDLGRLITSLSCPTATASCPAQSCPQLLTSLEQAYLQLWILEGPLLLAKRLSNMKVLYFFQTTFRDYFNAHLLKRFDNIFSHAIAFPALCEDFVSVLHPDCPEEYTEVVQESKNLANEFTEEIAKTGVKLVENYCQLMLNQERKEINIKDAAKLYHEKEQEIKRKEQEKANPKNKGKKGSRRERTKTMKKVPKKRGPLFSEKIEKLTIAMKELFNIFGPQPSLNVAGSVFRPTAAFQVKLYEEILDKTRALIKLEGKAQEPVLPSLVLQGLNTYQAVLTSIDPGLHFDTMFQEALFSTRTEDPHPYLVKFCDKIIASMRSPYVFYCEPLASFVGLSKDMQIIVHHIEKLTSAHELECLFEIFGVDGQLFVTQRLAQAISQQAGKVIELLNVNSALLSDPEARERESAWRGLQLMQISGFLEATIELGKLVALAELVDSAILSVTKDRVSFLEAAIDNVCTSDMSRLLGVPDSILPIASAMGYPKVTGQGESGKVQAEQLLIMTSVLVPFLARLETMRYYPHTMNSASVGDPAPLIEAHQNSLNCLLYALSYLRGEEESGGDCNSLLARYALPLGYAKPEMKDAGSGTLGALLLALALLPQDSGVPFSVELSAKRSAMLDNSPRPEVGSLQAEFEGKRITRLMKK